MAQQERRRFRFTFIGWQDGWYQLRLPATRLPALDLHAFRNDVVEWLIEQEITLNTLSYMTNGNTGDGPVVPAAADGRALFLLLRRPADVIRFQMQFGCRGVTPEALFAAVHAEASVHKFVMGDLAYIAYDAIRRFVLVFADEDFPEWVDLDDDPQQFFLQMVREYLEDTARSAKQMHEAWMDRRQIEGWRYAAQVDLAGRLHPRMVPFDKLSERDQFQTRLMVNAIVSLAPMLRR